MTDRLKGFTVVLEQNLRDDDAEPIKAAIEQIRGVLSVEPVLSGSMDVFAESRIRHELRMKLVEVLR